VVPYFSGIIIAHKVHRPLNDDETSDKKKCCSQYFNLWPCTVLSRNIPLPGQDVWWTCRSVSAK